MTLRSTESRPVGDLCERIVELLAIICDRAKPLPSLAGVPREADLRVAVQSVALPAHAHICSPLSQILSLNLQALEVISIRPNCSQSVERVP
jgi:hypothetical protein